jgi:hypothetical protein
MPPILHERVKISFSRGENFDGKKKFSLIWFIDGKSKKARSE